MKENIIYRKAKIDDLSTIVQLLLDDGLGAKRESRNDLEPYLKAFDLIDMDSAQMLVVMCIRNKIIGTCHLTLMPSLTFIGSIRLNIEAVRIDSDLRDDGYGEQLIRWAISYGKTHGASVIQLATNKERTRAKNFYEKLGFVASHEGMKLLL